MALPLILLGAATLAGGFGIKKGFDAKSLFKRSSAETVQAQKRFEITSKKLEEARDTAQIMFETLGHQKMEVYKNSLIPFVEHFSKIKNVDFKDGTIFDAVSFNVTQTDMLALLDVSLKMKDIVTAGVGCLGGSGLTVLAVHGGAGLFGTASAGTVFNCASGVAATSSVVACMGGGGMAAAGGCVGSGAMAGAAGMASIAGAAGGMAGMAGMAGGMAGSMAGGMGMGGGAGAMAGAGAAGCVGAGGTAGGISGGVVSGVAGGVAGGTVSAVTGGVTSGTVASMVSLGGVIAGPFLAVGGMALAAKAKIAKEHAATNIARSNAAVQHMKNMQVAIETVSYRVCSIFSVLYKLNERFTPLLVEVQNIVAKSSDYMTYDDRGKKIMMMAAMLAKTIKNVMETSILDDQGVITTISEQIVEESKRVLQSVVV